MEFVYLLLAMGIMLLSSSLVTSKFNKYRNVPVDSQMTGYETARKILDFNGLQDVTIERVNHGTLSDFYDPRKRSVHLSPDVYNGSSIVSVAVAAHEVGHAIQHSKNYGFLALRNKMLPAAMLGTNLGWTILFISFITRMNSLFYVGVGLVVALALFQLVTLPVELDASKRAAVMLTSLNIVDEDEIADVKSMLNAAAFTYIAAFLSTVLQLLRFVAMNNRRND